MDVVTGKACEGNRTLAKRELQKRDVIIVADKEKNREKIQYGKGEVLKEMQSQRSLY